MWLRSDSLALRTEAGEIAYGAETPVDLVRLSTAGAGARVELWLDGVVVSALTVAGGGVMETHVPGVAAKRLTCRVVPARGGGGADLVAELREAKG